jgi:microcystin-dependent protein
VSQPYVGEIRMFGGNFAPVGWAFCQGQLMPIAENDTLFNLIGTTYGGDGQETFGLPDLQGRVPVHAGKGPDGTNYALGETGGVESVTLSVQQMPIHSHPLLASTTVATQETPPGNLTGQSEVALYVDQTPFFPMNPSVIPPVGGSQPHENMQPFLVISYIISLYGIYPTQN